MFVLNLGHGVVCRPATTLHLTLYVFCHTQVLGEVHTLVA